VDAPIVFLPALGLTQHSWAGVTAKLGACRPRVLVDLPGVGEAPPAGGLDADAVLAALVEVVDAVAPDGRVVLAGHSLGGAIAARLAERLGTRVEALMLVAAPLTRFPLSVWERLLLLPSLWPPFLHVAGAWTAVRLGLARVDAGGGRVAPLDVALIADEWSDHRRRGAVREYYRAFLEGQNVERNGEAERKVAARKLCVWGADDRIVPPSPQPIDPSCRNVTVPGAGHLMPLTMPATIAEVIDRFLADAPMTPQPSVDRAMVTRDGARRPDARVWSARRELFPLVGVGALFAASGPPDGRVDLSFHAGIARGGIDPHFPVEAGRVALLVGAAIRGDTSGWQFAYLQATGRFELIWRWGGGYHVDGTLMVDPRNGRVGGYGAIGYAPSVVPWLRAFVGGGELPGGGARFLVGVDVTARLTGLLF
jgi:pimeloyl-ACP methyl ester carboxylesterase